MSAAVGAVGTRDESILGIPVGPMGIPIATPVSWEWEWECSDGNGRECTMFFALLFFFSYDNIFKCTDETTCQ